MDQTSFVPAVAGKEEPLDLWIFLVLPRVAFLGPPLGPG